MKVIEELKVSAESSLGYSGWTTIGTIAKVIDEFRLDGGVKVGKVVDVTGSEVPLANIRMNITKISKDHGLKILTRSRDGMLAIYIVE